MACNKIYFFLISCLLAAGGNSDNSSAVSPAPSEPPIAAPSEAPIATPKANSSDAPLGDTIAADDAATRGPLPADCGTTRYDNTTWRIVEGERARLGQFPWIVRLGMKFRNMFKFFCGGSIISRYYVISAAHCTELTIQMCGVRVGDNYLDTDRDCDSDGTCAPPHQDIYVKSKAEPDYCFETTTNDLLLIELETPVQFNEFVRPICLTALVPNNVLAKGHMTISGWGYTRTHPPNLPRHLMYINAPLVPQRQCNVIYRHTLIPSQLCIGYKKGKDSCGGDSGGPVGKDMERKGRKRAYLVGVVSYGLVRCGSGPAVYTNVPYYQRWILERIKKY